MMINVFSSFTDDARCNNWLHMSNALGMGGDEFMKVADGLTLEECKTACVDAEANYGFYCSAALTRKSKACYLIGFHVRDNYWATQFFRTCKIGKYKFLLY